MGDKDADKVISDIEDRDNFGGWGPWQDDHHFQGDEVKNTLEEINGLSDADLKKVFDKLSMAMSNGYVESPLTRLAKDAKDQGFDPKYATLVASLSKPDPQAVLDARKTENEAKEKVTFRDGWGWETRDEKNHLEWVDLYVPKGASDSLTALIGDTQFTMQWGFDTLGAHEAKDAPPFSKILDSDPNVKEVDGWSQIKDDHEKIVKQLTDRQHDQEAKLNGVNLDTLDTKILGKKVFTDLKTVKDNLNDQLKIDYLPADNKAPGPYSTRDGDDINYYSGDPQHPIKTTVYQKSSDGNFYLTAQAEQMFYVSAIHAAVDDWHEKYKAAIKDYSDKAAKVDGGDDNGGNNNGGKKDGGNDNGGNNNGGNNNGGNNNGGNNNGGTTTTGQDALNGQGNDQPQNFSDLFPAGLTDGTATDPSATGDGTTTDATGTDTTGTDATGTDGTQTSTTEPASWLNQAIDDIKNSATAAPAAATSAQNSAQPVNPLLNMMPGLGSALGGMGQGNGPFGSGVGNSGGVGNPDGTSGSRFGRQGQQPPSAPFVQPAAATSSQPLTGFQPGVVSASATSPGPVPANSHSMVDMKLPDGSAQKVSAVVADVVNKEMNNPNGCNADGAYGNALGQLTQIDPSAAHTGDIVRWGNHSAVIVREGPDNAYMVVDGQMKPLNLMTQGSLTDYTFFHPSGADPSDAGQSQRNTAQSVAATTATGPGVSAEQSRQI
ncbi:MULTISPECIES: hypothetical protein [Nocardia]|uniref:hypothetical protein n=1 Tax=Nocardia TaxID=1817 RepID=UPI0007EAA8E2|nr:MULTISPECIES: hypothetical protein [Nocardia]MBF6274825.1 hypothetical protein [Nocardia nova]OBA53275.1 hypothetical protein A5789_24140 [Nocardia sp. 852002-51101_SCH5132738]OBB29572.1 hypothetical protein A5748_09910 [Nocardia sp. 852002-51244_SCH5132740]OBF66065.1 hypothetical protein A9X06_06995 [Mycobacterium sp. 852002-51759_SCH5129042]